MTKLLIFGASGHTGRLVVGEALAAGHTVTAFVRDPAKLAQTTNGLTLFKGDVRRPDDVTRALAGQELVVSVLGFANTVRDPELVAAFAAIVAEMQRQQVNRLIYLSSLGVPGGKAPLSWFVRAFIVPTFLRYALADHAADERVIRASSLDWTIVRPPRLTDGPKRSTYRHGTAIRTEKLVAGLSRADLAAFLVGLVASHDYSRQAVTITD